MKRIFLTLLIILLPVTCLAGLPGFMKVRMGTMSGQIIIDGEPLPGAIVSFFLESKGPPPIDRGMRRVPEFLTRTDQQGRFQVKLVQGKYYVGIMIRDKKQGPGPPRAGDTYYFASSGDGKLRLLSIAQKEIVDVGQVLGAPPDSFEKLTNYFTIEGVVRKAGGEPFKGAVVLGKSQMTQPRPEFIAERTGDDGKYRMKLPVDKPFYLIARQTIAAARPRPGDYLGTYGIKSTSGMASPAIFSAGSPPPGVLGKDRPEGNDRAVAVLGGKGETQSKVDIFMYQVPDPAAIKESIQGTPDSPKFEQGTALNNIFFDFNSYRLKTKSYQELDRWAAFLKGRAEIKIEISGHTDDLGSATYNRELSSLRAGSVAAYLKTKGVDGSRVKVLGFGADRPVSSNDTPGGRSRNRRVEIKFINSGVK